MRQVLDTFELVRNSLKDSALIRLLAKLCCPKSCLAVGMLTLLASGSGCDEMNSGSPGMRASDIRASTPPSLSATGAGGESQRSVRVASSAASSVATTETQSKESLTSDAVPKWAASAVFYQVFPERFCNGDPTNDPTRESLEFPGNVGENWKPTSWTSDWYARADWEQARGDSFYEDGVFDRRYGGDLQGVIDKLDYLRRLGINALYLNPVFYARSLHKYDGNTYHHIDPYFGPDPDGDLELMATETSDPETWKWTAADKLFLELLNQAHRRKIRVVVDGVFNHTGRDFFAFNNLRELQQESPYKDWYVVQSFDDPHTDENEFRYKGWWGVDTLPEFANNATGDNLHPGPKQYIFDATRRWMDPNHDGDPSDGIDGWRLDVAVEVPIGFWKEWNHLCREINKECYTVAENWEDAAGFLAAGGFSATMNYHGFSFPVKGYLIDGSLSASDAAASLMERAHEFPKPVRYAVQNLIDSHDTDRVASMIVNSSTERAYLQPSRFDYDVGERVTPRSWDQYKVTKPNGKERRIQRLVGLMQATFVGAPLYYYGTESGMWGADDPCDRMPMVWQDLKYDPQSADPLNRDRKTDKVSFDRKLYGFYEAINWFRRQYKALQTGEIEIVTTDDAKRILVMRRYNDRESLVVVFNRSETEQTILLPIEGKAHEVFTASGQPDKVSTEKKADGIEVRLPGLEGVVLRHHPQRK